MNYSAQKLLLAGVVAMVTASCSHDQSLFQGPDPEPEAPRVSNTFDFKTTQAVNLSVDFSSVGAIGAVYFDVFTENPIIETTVDGITTVTRDENIKPVYGDYTNKAGRFSQKVTLPAYATHLYI